MASAIKGRRGVRTSVTGMVAAAVLALAVLVSPTQALEFPARTGPVVDEVGMIDAATRAKLVDRLTALEGKTHDQVMVVVVKSLRDTSIDAYNIALTQHWDLGGTEGRSAVLTLAPKEGKIGMHAGSALGGKLTKAVMDRIFDQSILPAFGKGDVPGGLLGATDDIIEVLTGARPQAPPTAETTQQNAITMAMIATVFASPTDDTAPAVQPSTPATRTAEAVGKQSPPRLAHFPTLSGRVVDEAGILGSRRDLTDRLAALESRTTDQLVAATVRSLRGQSIEQYANGLFREWKIGQKDKNNGVLLIVAPTERKVRIEVGYGLEGILTDALARSVIEQAILPRFKSNDMPGGISRGVDEIIAILTADPAEARARAETAGKPSFIATAILPPLLDVGAFIGKSLLALMLIAVACVFLFLIGFVATALLVNLGVLLHILPKRKDRAGGWKWLNSFDSDDSKRSHRSGSSDSDSSWSSSSSDSFSGGGGSSGSW